MKVLKSKAFFAFCFGFALYILIMLPELISNNGVIIFGADFRMQSLPFTYHIRDCITSGNVIWDHSSGLGAQFLSSYSFYNLFSPFTLLYLIVPRNSIVYVMPYIMALKYGLGTMLAYFYAARFLKNKNYAVLAGVLYRFSTASAYNLIFHFEDIFTFFPLMLIALEELCVNKRKGVFAVTAGFLALLNFYFFIGETVFAVIYFFVRGLFDKEFGLSVKKSLQVLFEGVIGVMCGMMFLMPVGISLLANDRATSTLPMQEWLIYDHPFTYLKIIQNAFMMPDPFGYTTMFPTYETEYPFGTTMSSLAAYLPVFSLTGVISYIVKKRKSWESVLLLICAVMAFVPVLNQLFSALNDIYYARWMFMPLLICSLISMKALEEEISFKPGIITCGSVYAALVVYQIVLYLTGEAAKRTAKGEYDGVLNITHLLITGASLVIVLVIIRTKRDRKFFPTLFVLSAIGTYLCFGVMFNTAANSLNDKTNPMKSYEFNTEKPAVLCTDTRVSTMNQEQNFTHIWQNNSTSFFNSMVSKGYADFITANDMGDGFLPSAELKVMENPEIADLVSVKFTICDPGVSPSGDYEYAADFGDYDVLENTRFIPLGFAYDKMISYDDFMSLEKTEKHRANMKYIITKDFSQFKDVLTEEKPDAAMSDEEYQQQLENRRAESSYNLQLTRDGLISNIRLPEKRVVMYSLSNDGGWTAFIDGEKAEVYDVNNGLCGVIVPEGDHEVVLKYTVRGFAAGCVISAAAAAVLVGYIVLFRKKKTVSAK